MGTLESMFTGIFQFHWQYLIMYAIGGILIYLAIAKDYEPMLLLPIGFGAILANLPLNAVWGGADGAWRFTDSLQRRNSDGAVPGSYFYRDRRDDRLQAALLDT